MKKCRSCGAIQNDSRSRCIDCGERLPKSLPDSEAAEISAELDDRLNKMSDRTEDFYVPICDKIMAAISLIGIIAAVVLLIYVSRENTAILATIPEGFTVDFGSGFTTIMSDGEIDYTYPSAWKNRVDDAGIGGIIALISFVFAIPMLLMPRLMWHIGTLRYRIFYGWDTSPSYFALIVRKAASYLLFACGVGSLIYGYVTLF